VFQFRINQYRIARAISIKGVADISARFCHTEFMEASPMKPGTAQVGSKKIGLVGGLALRAGIFYYAELVKQYAATHRPLPLMLNHADVNTVLAFVRAGDKHALGEYLGALANELFEGGANLVAVTAVAPHLAADEIARAARGPIVNVLDLILPNLRARGINRVAVFGNRAVMETNVFGSVPQQMIIARSPALIDAVHTTYTDIALNGKRGTHREVQFLDSVARELIEDGGAQAILLAGTDLSSFYADQPPTYASVDLARLHVDEIVRRAQVS
jgi:aspartate racemase